MANPEETPMPSVAVTKIVFSSGDTVEMEPNEKVIIVGSNNSGKSQTLKELFGLAEGREPRHCVVVQKLEVSKSGSKQELKDFLEKNASYSNENYYYRDWTIIKGHLDRWEHHPFLPNGLCLGFFKQIDADKRLDIVKKQSSIGPYDQKTKPQHVLFEDDKLMSKISKLFRKAFGKELLFDFRGGKVLPIHVGESPAANLVDRVGDEYVNSVRANPLLDEQGDGMKGYAGILFESVASPRDVTLIDEPEAFLHPPQMRKLGEALSSEVEGQLFVATHSSDILRGFLEGTEGQIRILRIRREGNENFVSEAPQSSITELWTKPELRYSNALEGIFHEQTLICEDDSDCRLYNSVADHLASTDSKHWFDTAYVPTGGKAGVAKVAVVLREIGVPTKAVFDIDFLNNKELVKKTVEAFGGNWSILGRKWELLDIEVRNGTKTKTISQIKQSISKIIDDSEEDKLPKSDIIEEMKQSRPWAIVKKHGCQAIPNGQAQNYYTDLINELEQIGIYVVPVGEIENFSREIGLHGSKFVNELLSTIPLDDSKLSELREFVRKVHRGNHCPLDKVNRALKPVSNNIAE